MTRRYLSAALALLAVAAVAPAAAAGAAAAATAGKVSHAKFFQNKSRTVDCGVEIHLPNKPATNILCGAPNLPVVPHNVGDPFIQIGAHGKPHIVYISQDSFVSNKLVTLKPGSKWSALGVSCTVQAKTVRCTNKSKHGFTAGGKYKRF